MSDIVIVDSQLHYIIINFFEHPQKPYYWSRVVRDAATYICEELLTKNYLIPEAVDFYKDFVAKLRLPTKIYLSTKDRFRFLQTCYAAIKRGWIKKLPSHYRQQTVLLSASSEGLFPIDIENNMDLFARFSPALLRLDVLNYLQNITRQFGIPLSCGVDITKDKPITINVLTSKSKLVEEELKKSDAYLYIGINNTDIDNGFLVQHANTWSTIYDASNTTIGAIVKDRDGNIYGITTAHGFIHPDRRTLIDDIYPPGIQALYIPSEGIDIALVKLDIDSTNMINYTGKLKYNIAEGKNLLKAGGSSGITSNTIVVDGYACETDNRITYQNVLCIHGSRNQSMPGDCGSLHSEKLDDHQFLPLGIHIGSIEGGRYQAALNFTYNFESLCDHHGLNSSDFTFHNRRNPSNIQIIQGTINNDGASCTEVK